MSMKIEPTAIPDVLLLTPKKFGDERGFFSEVYSREALRTAGLDLEFVQDNHAYSQARGVLRGLHYQIAPRAQDKLVRVTRGAIFDVAVDVRRGSPTFGRRVCCELSARNWQQILVPKGFAHGYVTLEPDTEVIYKVTDLYAPQLERGLLWSDPDLGIPWPLPAADLTINDRDRAWPALAAAGDLF
jgi:dTDP-4-dehydrorhamnose 3,5-epimerase